jgi:type VI secretion system secreted protein VgrG
MNHYAIAAALMLTFATPVFAQTPTPIPTPTPQTPTPQTPTPQPSPPQTLPPQTSASPYCDEFGCQSGTLVPKGLIEAVDPSSTATPTGGAAGLPYTCTVYATPADLEAYLNSLPPAQRRCFSWYVPNITGPDGVGNYFFLSCPTGGDDSPFCGTAESATPTPTPTPTS